MCTSDEPSVISVLIVDDHPMALDALSGYLETAADIEVVACTADGEQAVTLVQEHVPDVVLMDLVLDGSEIDGVEATRCITDVSPSTQVLALSAYGDDEHVFPALKAGAMGYVLKTASSDRILDGIRAVARRQPFLDHRVYEKLRHFLAQVREEVLLPEPVPRLTPREQEVLDLLAEGLSNQQIADRLVIGVRTVKTHVSNILQKLHLSDRTQVRFWALQHRTQGNFEGTE
jgi:NarL family two-component system response regulator LiaR